MSELKEILWYEKYRPQKIEDCILPDSLKTVFQQYVEKSEIPTLLLCGTSGVGKTTVAMAMCKEAGIDHMIINGSEETGIDTLRVKIRGYASTMSLTGGRKVVIIDEADYMNPNSLQPALRAACEEFSKNCTFIFTCNHKNKIIDPLQGRCATIDFSIKAKDKPTIAAKFMKRLDFILKSENVTYEPKVLSELILKYFPNFRKIINELQKYAAMSGNQIDSGILQHFNDVELKDLIQHLKSKDFVEVRKWVNINSDNDPSRIYRRIYDGLTEHLKPSSIPEIIVTLAKYQYQHAFVADGVINLLACLVEIMVNGEFK